MRARSHIRMINRAAWLSPSQGRRMRRIGLATVASKFVGIPTSDQQRSLRFYTEKLGFAVSTDQPFDGKQRWIEMRVANATTRIVLFTPEGHEDRIAVNATECGKYSGGARV